MFNACASLADAVFMRESPFGLASKYSPHSHSLILVSYLHVRLYRDIACHCLIFVCECVSLTQALS